MASDCLISLPAPDFTLPTILGKNGHEEILSLQDFAGEWLVLVFYPRDFSFVCPTELASFSHHIQDFQHRGCQVLGISVDTIETHREWLQTPTNDGGVGELEYRLVSDTDGQMARAYKVWSEEDAVAFRGTFLIDPAGIVQYQVVHNLSVGRSVDEILRVLAALKSGGLCPASWTTADGNIDTENALKPGRVLSHYRITGVAGEGAFGRVFSAWDLRLERPVALKIIRRQSRQSREAVLNEARSAASLLHPNICTIYAVEELEGLSVIAMELLDGEPLSTVLQRPISLADRLKLAEGIAAGLAAAHAKKIVHGDLKPDNIIVGPDFVPRILDFGLANRTSHSKRPPSMIGSNADLKAIEAACAESTSLSETWQMPLEGQIESSDNGGIRGTPAYMAPEQWLGNPATTASDIYGFGLILFELLTSNRALPDVDLQRILKDIQDPELPKRLAGHLPAELRPLCEATLAIDSTKRPTAEAIIAALPASL